MATKYFRIIFDISINQTTPPGGKSGESMKVIEKSTGAEKTAQYITTPAGNKRMSVDGITYTDKQFERRFIKTPVTLEWQVNTCGLLKEIADGYPGNGGILYQPLNIFRILLSQVAERATEINDPILNALMCRLALYGEADPYCEDYNEEKSRLAMTHPEYLKWH